MTEPHPPDRKPMSVERITRDDALPWIMRRHYAHRVPSISEAFGLIVGGTLEGVCTFGTPPSHTLLKGVAGPRWASRVWELNRLTCRNQKNYASFLVGRALRMIERPRIVVSYADTAAGHVGYVYQATNFLYTGMSASFTDPVVEGLEHQHHATFAHGKSNAEMREIFGDRVTFKKRSPKHRYVFICATNRDRKAIMSDFRYQRLPYPKLGPSRINQIEEPERQCFLFGGSD